MLRNVMRKYSSTSARLLGCAMIMATAAFALSMKAGGPNGTQDGWAINNNGTPILTSARAAQLTAAKTGWIRLGFRLVPGQTNWNSTMLGYYDTVVNNARAAGLQVFGLINSEGWNGNQATWNANNHENTSGNGDNPYVDSFASNAVGVIVQHFHDRIKVFEIWNEPSTWTTHSGSTYSGATYVYPSVYSWMMNKCWIEVHINRQIGDVQLITGGIFGTSDNGASDPGGNSGSNWLSAVYSTGITVGSFASSVTNLYGGFPVDGIGQHLYIDYNVTTTSANVLEYLNLVRGAYTKYEGGGTRKKTWLTEFGWSTVNVSQSVQAANLTTAFNTMNAGASGAYVANANWFSFQDNAAANLYFGLLDVSSNQKTAYGNFKTKALYEGQFSNGTTDNNILNYFNSAGGQAAIGDAFDNGGSAYVHSWSGNGINSANVQDFGGGSHSNLTVFDSSAGKFEVNNLNGLWNYYLSSGGIGWFGVPLNNEYTSGAGTRQDFANGNLTQSSSNGITWTAEALLGQYYTGTNFNTLVMTRLDPGINYNWSTTSPGPNVPLTDYSVNWTGTVTPLYSETYTFYTQSDDGVRLWVNGQQLVNDWNVHGSKQDSGMIALTAGQPYSINMQYFQHQGNAVAQLSWSSASQAMQIIPGSALTSPTTGLFADYYNGTNFDSHVISRIDSTVNFTWTSPPAASMGRNCYSVQWSGTVTPLFSETYTFYTQSDDGARLWVNGQQLVNDWNVHGSKEDSGTITLTAGQPYSIVMQYFQYLGGSVAQLSWSSPSQAKQIIPQNQLNP